MSIRRRAWLEQRQRVIASGFPAATSHHHHIFVTQPETARAALLQRANYIRTSSMPVCGDHAV